MKDCSVIFSKYLFIVFLFFIAGCATHRYAHTETPLGDNTYRIAYRGDPFSAPEKVQNKFFRKCAEITLSSDYKYFTLTPSNETVTEDIKTPAERFGFQNLEPQHIYTLRMFSHKPNINHAYNAAAIYNSLASKRMLRKMEYNIRAESSD